MHMPETTQLVQWAAQKGSYSTNLRQVVQYDKDKEAVRAARIPPPLFLQSCTCQAEGAKAVVGFERSIINYKAQPAYELTPLLKLQQKRYTVQKHRHQ
jgi:hypothetical protein